VKNYPSKHRHKGRECFCRNKLHSIRNFYVAPHLFILPLLVTFPHEWQPIALKLDNTVLQPVSLTETCLLFCIMQS
jgi:hypothetical protein